MSRWTVDENPAGFHAESERCHQIIVRRMNDGGMTETPDFKHLFSNRKRFFGGCNAVRTEYGTKFFMRQWFCCSNVLEFRDEHDRRFRNIDPSFFCNPCRRFPDDIRVDGTCIGFDDE